MFRLTVQDVFFIKGRGVVATGRVEAGQARVGEEVRINGARPVQIAAIEQFRKKVAEAAVGDTIGLLFSGLQKGDLSRGDVLTSGAGATASGGVEVTL